MLWKSVLIGLGIAFLSIGIPPMIPNSIRIVFFILGVLLILGTLFYDKLGFSPIKKSTNNEEKIQNVFGEIANLYNQTGVFVQESFNSSVSSSGSKSQSLHRGFEDFVEYINAIKLSIPQELEVAVMSFFDLLLDYKKQADLIAGSSKTNKCYAQWMDLKQKFDNDIAPHYSQLEVRFRKLLKKNNPHNQRLDQSA